MDRHCWARVSGMNEAGSVPVIEPFHSSKAAAGVHLCSCRGIPSVGTEEGDNGHLRLGVDPREPRAVQVDLNSQTQPSRFSPCVSATPITFLSFTASPIKSS